MNKVILICGKMCSGKTTYAKSLIKINPAVLLSIDEITTIYLGTESSGAEYWEIYDKTRMYLYNKSLEIIESGIDVILDWGFWRQTDRRSVTSFYEQNNILIEWHYIDASNEILLKNLNNRNHSIKAGEQISSYYFSNDVAKKLWEEKFEIPATSEMDIWYINRTN